MPALTLPTMSSDPTTMEDGSRRSNSESPTAPPYSPITPVMSNSLSIQEAQRANPPTELPPMPVLQPFSESDNPDAIALRSATSILQIQRQQTLRDLKALQMQKKAAVRNPESFARAVVEGNVKTRSSGVLGSGPDFTPAYFEYAEANGNDETTCEDDTPPNPYNREFEDIPGPQNVVRCPPINWAKYHVVGPSLENLHEEQRRRPINNLGGDDRSQGRAEEHVLAAPFNALKDHLGPRTMKDHTRPAEDHSGE